MNNKVSIIVPVYNGKEYIESTINTLLASTHKLIEVILINDGSSDGSAEMCEKLKSKDERIILYHQKNQGIVAARNKGLELATGDFICFCDQDDIVPYDTYEKMLNVLYKNDAKVCISSTGKYANGSFIPYEVYKDDLWDRKKIVQNIVLPLYFDGYTLKSEGITKKRITGTIWKCMISRELVESGKIKFKRFVNFEDDLLFFLDVLSQCERIVTLEHIGYYWRMNQNSESYRWKYIEQLEEKEKRYFEYLDHLLEKYQVSEQIRQEYEKYFFCTHVANLIDNEGSPQNSRKRKERIPYLKKAIYTDVFIQNIDGYNNIEWGYLKKKIVLKLVSLKLLSLAYYFNIFYRNIKKFGVQFKVWSTIEKHLRGK